MEHISINVAEAIPYENFKEKINIVMEELKKNRYVEIMDKPKIIYSAEKWGDRKMKFNKDKFLKHVNKSDKRLYSKYLNDMEGKEVYFDDTGYGTIKLSDGDTIYPIYKEWCDHD